MRLKEKLNKIMNISWSLGLNGMKVRLSCTSAYSKGMKLKRNMKIDLNLSFKFEWKRIKTLKLNRSWGILQLCCLDSILAFESNRNMKMYSSLSFNINSDSKFIKVRVYFGWASYSNSSAVILIELTSLHK